jgi:hypothetical protein
VFTAADRTDPLRLPSKGRYQVCHLRHAVHLESIDTLLQFAVGMGHSFVLTQMLDPGIQHEGLDEVALLRQIFVYLPTRAVVISSKARADSPPSVTLFRLRHHLSLGSLNCT